MEDARITVIELVTKLHWLQNCTVVGAIFHEVN